MRLSELGLKQRSKKRAIAWPMDMYQNCGNYSYQSLKDAILTHPDVRKRLDVFALSIYGLVVFPKALGHVDEAVTDLFNRLDKRVTPIPKILAETFRVSYRVFSKNYSPLKDMLRRGETTFQRRNG
ncbi:hypothetical protein Gotur_026268 [Gossypium turneri]